MKKIAILLFIASSVLFAQNTYVPDDKFEQALIDLGYDTTLDDSVVTANISGVTSLNIGEKEISDLTGIEAFVALKDLRCHNNKLTSLDVSSNTALNDLWCAYNQLTSLDVCANTALTTLHCDYNKFTSLDVSSNTALVELHCGSNQLTSLDVSANTALTYLNCESNQLTSLDMSSNTALTGLNCNQNQLTSLDVSNNTALSKLECLDNKLTSLDVSANTALTVLNVNYNKLTSLDVSKNTALKFFKCADNQLTSLDVSKNTALETLSCYVNQLTSLDVSKNTALTTLDCNSNQLTSLDVSSNTKLTVLQCHYNHQLTNLNMRNGITDQLTTFNATKSATTLTCIEVLDPAWATANWTSANGNIEEGVTFSVICGAEAVTTWHVATTGSDGSGSGTLASPLATIQTGINAASDGDTVLVAPGEYFENIIAKSDKSLISSGGPLQTIINGNNEGMVINGFEEGSRFTVDGFTIKNGNGTGLSGSYAAVNFQYCKRINLKNLIITENTGMPPVIMSARDSSVVENVIIVNNSFPGAGNQAGGPVALEIIQGDPDSEVVLKNVTIANNGELDGINIQRQRDDNQWSVKLINSVIWTETSSINISDVDDNQTLYVYNSLIRGGENGIFDNNGTGDLNVVWGDGNIDVNPMFVDTANGNYHLKDWSQAIGAGTASGAPTTDIEGNPRPNPAGSNPDMGAYENKWGTPQNAPPVLTALSDVSVNEDESITVTLEAINADSADNDAITFSATSEKSEVKLSMGSSSGKLDISADENWNGSSVITVYASDGKDIDSTKFSLKVNPIQDAPYAFEWVSTASDTINISQSNLADTYELKWSESKDVDGETIDYLLSVKIGVYPAEEIYDTTSISVPITYEEFVENVFELFPMLPGATVKFSVVATDGIDTVKVTGDDRVVYVNRYDYLSIAAEGIPLEFALHDNYPNPFNPTTTLRFDLPELSDMTLTIYNMLGQKVKTFNMQSTPAGYHSVKWNATNDYGDPVGAGVYLYQLQTKDFVNTRKMVLLK